MPGSLLLGTPLPPPALPTCFLGSRSPKSRTSCRSKLGSMGVGNLELQNPEQKGAFKTKERDLGLLWPSTQMGLSTLSQSRHFKAPLSPPAAGGPWSTKERNKGTRSLLRLQGFLRDTIHNELSQG